MNATLATWMLLGLAAMPQEAGNPAKPAAQNIPPQAAPETRPSVVIESLRVVPIQEAKLSATKPGVLMELPAREGQSVKQGDLLGQVDDRESHANIKAAKAELAVAEKQASSDAPVQAAIAQVGVAEKELQASLDINAKKSNAVSPTEVERQRLTMVKAKYQVIAEQQEFEAAGLTVDVKAAQLHVAELDAELRKIVAPYDAEVVEVTRHVGEWVQAGDTVMHIVQMDRLRVQGFLHVSDPLADNKYPAVQGSASTPKATIVDPAEIIGRDCEVTVALPKGKTETFKTKVAFVSPIQGTGGAVRFWVEIENKKAGGRWVAQPGQMASVKVLLDPPPKPKAADPKAPAAKPVPQAGPKV